MPIYHRDFFLKSKGDGVVVKGNRHLIQYNLVCLNNKIISFVVNAGMKEAIIVGKNIIPCNAIIYT